MTTSVSTFLEKGTWTLDPAHTSVGFTVRHLVAAKVRGRFDSFSGTIEAGETPAESSVEVSIDAASIDTGIEERDNHLKSADFLDAENFPALTFASTAVRDTDSGLEIEGELTIRGVTKPVVLEGDFGGVIEDPWGNEKAIFSVSTTIDREQWGLTWNQALEAGGWLVGKDVTIQIEAQATKA